MEIDKTKEKFILEDNSCIIGKIIKGNPLIISDSESSFGNVLGETDMSKFPKPPDGTCYGC